MRRGIVKSFRRNHHRDIDGLFLDDGTEVRFPPHVGHQVEAAMTVGDMLKIDGETKTKPRGEVVFEARRIEGPHGAIDVHGPKNHRPNKAHEAEVAMNATGTLVEFHLNRHGDLDGFRLNDETEVKFPPHLAHELEACVAVGAIVLVEGRRHLTPKGDIHLHVDRIVNQVTQAVVSRHEPFRSVGHDTASQPSHSDILKEIKELRLLIEQLRMPKPKPKAKPKTRHTKGSR